MLGKNSATEEISAIVVYDSHDQAERAVRELQKAGFDLAKLSVVGKGSETEDRVIGYLNTGDRIKHWGKSGAFWGGIWGLIMGSAFLVVPTVGPVLIAGALVAALQGAVVGGGMSVIGAALFSLGVPKNTAIRYESALRASKYLVAVHGTDDEVQQARDILETVGPGEVAIYSKRPVETPVKAKG